MKISLLIDALGAGGAQRQLVGLACLLKEAGYDIEVITYYYMDFYNAILSNKNIPHIYIKEAQSKKSRIFYIGKYLRRSKPHVVIAYQSTPALIASIIKYFNNSFKLIVSERNTSQRYTYVEKLRFNLYRVANWVVPNSYSQANFIKKYAHFLIPKLKVISNFVDLNKFVPNKTYGYRKSNQSLHILTYARITPQKNIINYLYSLKQVLDYGINIYVDWYGYKDGDGSYYMTCKKKVSELGLQDVFHFHEPIQDVVYGYHSCDVFCLPSLFEGTPNVICEAMSCGVPILCSDVCDNAILVKHNLNGLLFDPYNINDIATSIIQFSKLSISEKMNMSLSSRNIAEKNFSAKYFLEQYEQLIKQ